MLTSRRVATPSRARSLVFGLARGRRVAFVYAAVVLLVGAALALLPQHVQDTVVLQSSTNLTNLSQHPFGVLFASAFVVSNLGGLWQLPLLLWGYGAVERWLGAAAAVIVGLLGHVGATLLVVTVLVTGIQRGVFDLEVSRVADVGVSTASQRSAGCWSCGYRVATCRSTSSWPGRSWSAGCSPFAASPRSGT